MNVKDRNEYQKVGMNTPKYISASRAGLVAIWCGLIFGATCDNVLVIRHTFQACMQACKQKQALRLAPCHVSQEYVQASSRIVIMTKIMCACVKCTSVTVLFLCVLICMLSQRQQ
jgi:hypothetical protein